ncbi:MAG TPA: chorismate-binding protein [Thermoanaerobaculia bacterium]|nr:chorismate-binding protein [Thermoanaerobaculia bacterium]
MDLDAAQLDALRRDYDVIPLVRILNADTITPVAAFAALAERKSEAFLLESVERGESIGRYSFAGADPRRSMTIRKSSADPREALRNELVPLRVYGEEALPPFFGGAVGWLGYGAACWSEKLPDRHSAPDSVDAELLFFDQVVAFDHLRQRLYVCANLFAADERSSHDLLNEARSRLDSMTTRLSEAKADLSPLLDEGDVELGALTSREDFCEAVAAAKRDIEAGEIFQVVLSQRWVAPYPSSEALALYRALRSVNPSPYMFLLRTRERTLVGASPEMLVRIEKEKITARPIAGTRRRGATADEDRALADELLADEKENAEHLMLVDLGRNDLSRVCRAGSVEVTEFRKVERYSHVMHLVSSVEGRLRPGVAASDALLAAFPAGTVSGAPKIRAMELIDRYEPVRRNAYAGAILYAGFSGNLDSCIAIRTVVLEGDRALVQAGAGIVYDSKPELEYDETVGKAGALVRALRIATAASRPGDSRSSRDRRPAEATTGPEERR